MDIRLKRTLKLLTDAFEELLSEKDMDDISVTEICARSTVSRNTFYRNFGDKYEFIEYYIQSVTERFIDKAEEGENLEDIYSYARHMHLALISFIESNSNFSKHALGQTTLVGTADVIIKQTARGITKRAAEGLAQANKKPTMPTEFLGLFYAAGMMQTLRWWLSEGRPVPAETLERYTTDFLVHCYEGFGEE